jgi:hypothetical protein
MANPEGMQALMASEDCPICLERFGPELHRCDPLQCNVPATCCHTICVPCGHQLLQQPPDRHRCPLCRADFSQWLPRLCGPPPVQDLYVMATTPGPDGVRSFRLGLEPGDDAFVFATFPGRGDLVPEVHRLLEATGTTDENGVDWFRVPLFTIVQALEVVTNNWHI